MTLVIHLLNTDSLHIYSIHSRQSHALCPYIIEEINHIYSFFCLDDIKKKTDFILWNFLIKKNSKVFSPKIKFLFQVHRHRDKQTNRKRFTAWNSKYKGIYNDTIFPLLPLSVCLPAQSVSRLHLLAYSFVCCFPSKMNGQMIFQLIEDMHVFWTYSSSIFTLGKRISAVFFFLLYASTHILKHCTDSTDFQLNVYLCVRVSIWGQSVYSPRNQREFFRCISKLHFGHIFLSLRQLSPHTDTQNLTWKIFICKYINAKLILFFAFLFHRARRVNV